MKYFLVSSLSQTVLWVDVMEEDTSRSDCQTFSSEKTLFSVVFGYFCSFFRHSVCQISAPDERSYEYTKY